MRKLKNPSRHPFRSAHRATEAGSDMTGTRIGSHSPLEPACSGLGTRLRSLVRPTRRLVLFLGLLLAPFARAQPDSASPPSGPAARFEMNLGAGLVVPITFSSQDPAAL